MQGSACTEFGTSPKSIKIYKHRKIREYLLPDILSILVLKSC